MTETLTTTTTPSAAVSEAARALVGSRRQRTKVCPICGERFTTTGRGLYDKEACRYRATYERRKNARTAARERRQTQAAQEQQAS